MHVDGGDELRVDLAFEHHTGNFDGLGIRDPEPIDKLGLLSQPFH